VSAGRRLLAVADALPVTVLVVIAGAGSFTHIRDTAAQHGQHGLMASAVAFCIDLTCVMAARSAPGRACRQEPPARPDTAGAPGPGRGRRAAARQAPRRRGNLPGRARRPRGPAGSRPAPRSPGSQRDRPLPARRAPPGFPRPAGTVSRNDRPFIRVREPVTRPHRQLIRVPVGAPPRLVPPGGGECAGRGEIKPSSGLPDSLYAHSS